MSVAVSLVVDDVQLGLGRDNRTTAGKSHNHKQEQITRLACDRVNAYHTRFVSLILDTVHTRLGMRKYNQSPAKPTLYCIRIDEVA